MVSGVTEGDAARPHSDKSGQHQLLSYNQGVSPHLRRPREDCLQARPAEGGYMQPNMSN